MIAAAGLTAASAGSTAARSPLPSKVRPGLQLYSVSDALGENLSETLKEIRRIGYREIEIPPVFTSPVADRRFIYRKRGDWPFLKRVFEDAGLGCKSIHLLPQKFPGFEGPTLDDDLPEQIELAHHLGASFIVLTMFRVPERLIGELKGGLEGSISEHISLDDWKWMADYLNDKAEMASRSGITLAYHNHHLEFRKFGELVAYDELLRLTDPKVKMEMDCGHLVSAGYDPTVYFDRYPGRFPLLHVKDVARRGEVYNAPTKSTEMGRGIIDWPSVFRSATRSGLVQYYVEEDGPYENPPLKRIRVSYDYLRSIST